MVQQGICKLHYWKDAKTSLYFYQGLILYLVGAEDRVYFLMEYITLC